MKELMISVSPQEAVNILNGDQTLLIRKSVPKDYVGWVNIYVKQTKPYLGYEVREYESEFILENDKDNLEYDLLNGQVVARFWLVETTTFEYENAITMGAETTKPYDKSYWIQRRELNAACIECENDLEEYGQGKTLYAWHIKKLQIFDTPLALKDFCDYQDTIKISFISITSQSPLTKAPSTYQYVWRKE